MRLCVCMDVCVVLFVCVCLQLEGYEGGGRDSEPNGSFLCASRQLLTVAENIGRSEIADVSVCSQQNTHTERGREQSLCCSFPAYARGRMRTALMSYGEESFSSALKCWITIATTWICEVTALTWGHSLAPLSSSALWGVLIIRRSTDHSTGEEISFCPLRDVIISRGRSHKVKGRKWTFHSPSVWVYCWCIISTITLVSQRTFHPGLRNGSFNKNAFLLVSLHCWRFICKTVKAEK